jgi:lipopolysaccharide transport system permease protein
MIKHLSNNEFVVIDCKDRLKTIDFQELWKYRDLFWFKVVSSYKAKHRQSVLSYLWALLDPAMNILFFTFIFGGLLNVDTGENPYVLFNATGILAWLLINSSLGGSTRSLLGESMLLQKVYYPRLYVPFIPVFTNLPTFLIQLIFTLVLVFSFGVEFSWNILLIPLLVVSILIFTVGIGFLLSSFVIQFRDLSMVINYVMRFAVYLTPVVYPLDKIPDQYLSIYMLNPTACFVESFRRCLLGGDFPFFWLACSTCLSILIFMLGLRVYRSRELNIVDAI